MGRESGWEKGTEKGVKCQKEIITQSLSNDVSHSCSGSNRYSRIAICFLYQTTCRVGVIHLTCVAQVA